MTLRDSYLCQRLKQPPIQNLGVLSVAHRVFGGGMLGLTDKAWDLLDQHCTIDYMGAAEYEFGELPKLLGAVAAEADKGNLVSFAFLVGPHERKLNWERQYRARKRVFPPARVATVFGICHKTVVGLVEERIRLLLQESKDTYVKGGGRFSSALDPVSEWDVKDPVMGWIEMSNGFLFFCDETMWRGFCGLFGVEPCSVPEAPATVDYTKMKKPELVACAVRLGMVRTKTEARKIPKPELLKQLVDSQEKSVEAELKTG